MDIQFNKLEGTNLYDELMEGHNWGFKVFRNLLDVNLTALDVADAYYYAKKKGYLTKDDQANYNNRWLQFRGDFHPTCERIAKYMKKRYKLVDIIIFKIYVLTENKKKVDTNVE